MEYFTVCTQWSSKSASDNDGQYYFTIDLPHCAIDHVFDNNIDESVSNVDIQNDHVRGLQISHGCLC